MKVTADSGSAKDFTKGRNKVVSAGEVAVK